MYNGLVRLNVRADEAWSDITVQLKRRYDLIPNLISTVKGYAKHEAETLQKVVKERSAPLAGNGSVKDVAASENMLAGALKSVFAVAESNPDLKANQNFTKLQGQLEGIENDVRNSRKVFNDAINTYNVKVRSFPMNLLAGMFGFSAKEGFKADEGAEKAPKVKF